MKSNKNFFNTNIGGIIHKVIRQSHFDRARKNQTHTKSFMFEQK